VSHLYTVLGVTKAADGARLKSAYRTLAKTWHPDLNGGDKRAEQRFKEINLAYETLRDPEQRETYDAMVIAVKTATRRRMRNAAVTMSGSFVITVSSGLIAARWLLGV
jgi:DnaJ-class molecular chaperone